MTNRGCYKDIAGLKTENLTVLDFSHMDNAGKSVWNVRCACGKILKMRGNSVTSGNSQSCGCLSKKLTRAKHFRGVGDAETGLSKSHWCRLKFNAKTRGFPVNVTMEEAYRLFVKQDRKCALSGVELQLRPLKTNETTASLDRIDSARGYERDNIQWVHKDLNMIKMDMNETVFLQWVGRIYEHRMN